MPANDGDPLRVVFTNGVFDLFHIGHQHLLSRAAEGARRLVVAVNSDGSTQRLKGDSRPVQLCATRIENVTRFLESLDLPAGFLVRSFEGDTPEEIIHAVQPDVLIKGSDSPRPLAGEEFVLSHGGSVRIIERLPGYSTSAIIEGSITA
ncbi:MAG: nucleotidyltransferase [Planctomycetaceae bacterium]|nr:nucleotidyltransferase [Planctomycetaceae bacterium]